VDLEDQGLLVGGDAVPLVPSGDATMPVSPAAAVQSFPSKKMLEPGLTPTEEDGYRLIPVTNRRTQVRIR
jgi:hypothetical protein